jgi:hypothetical protein
MQAHSLHNIQAAGPRISRAASCTDRLGRPQQRRNWTLRRTGPCAACAAKLYLNRKRAQSRVTRDVSSDHGMRDTLRN